METATTTQFLDHLYSGHCFPCTCGPVYPQFPCELLGPQQLELVVGEQEVVVVALVQTRHTLRPCWVRAHEDDSSLHEPLKLASAGREVGRVDVPDGHLGLKLVQHIWPGDIQNVRDDGELLHTPPMQHQASL